MLKLLSSFRQAHILEAVKTSVYVRSYSLHSVPKAYASTSTVEDAPKKKPTPAAKKERKKESFRQQLLKKNQERAKKLLLEFVHLVVHGSKSAYKDSKFLAGVVSSKPKKAYTVEEIRELQRIVRDLIKFVPFYAAVIIPGGELVLLPYLFLFPRAIPSYFLPENKIKEERYRYIDNQARAHRHLMTYLLTAMIKAGYDPSVKDPDGMKKFFIENKQKMLPLLQTKDMDSEMLRHANDFLMYEYVEGTFILNLLYKTTVNLPRHLINATMWVARKSYRAVWTHPFFNYHFTMNFFPFEFAKKKLLKYQFERQLKVMKAQNFAILLNLYGKLDDETVLDVARERGHYAEKEEEAKKWLKEEWNKVSKTNVESEVFLFWYSVIIHEHLS